MTDEIPTEHPIEGGADTAPPSESPAPAPDAEPPPPPMPTPQSYGELEVTLPDGFELDPAMMDAFKETAAKHGLTPDAAKDLLALQSKLTEQQAQVYARTRADWVKAASEDKEFGGAALAENLGAARKALSAFGSSELIDYLNASGLGDHPELVRTFWKIGRAMSEDGGVGASGGGGANSPAALSIAERLYPNEARK